MSERSPLPPGSVIVGGVTRDEPPLREEEGRAIIRGACKAVSGSPLARPVEPVGSHLRGLAKAIDGTDDDKAGGGDA